MADLDSRRTTMSKQDQKSMVLPAAPLPVRKPWLRPQVSSLAVAKTAGKTYSGSENTARKGGS